MLPSSISWHIFRKIHNRIYYRQYSFCRQRSTVNPSRNVTHIWGSAVQTYTVILIILFDVDKALRVWHVSLPILTFICFMNHLPNFVGGSQTSFPCKISRYLKINPCLNLLLQHASFQHFIWERWHDRLERISTPIRTGNHTLSNTSKTRSCGHKLCHFISQVNDRRAFNFPNYFSLVGVDIMNVSVWHNYVVDIAVTAEMEWGSEELLTCESGKTIQWQIHASLIESSNARSTTVITIFAAGNFLPIWKFKYGTEISTREACKALSTVGVAKLPLDFGMYCHQQSF